MISYLDEKAMNVAQELSDRELYDYDVLVRPGLTRRLEFRRQDRDFMAGRDAIKRMQTLTLIPSQSCVDWTTHRAHRNFGRNS